MKLSFRFVVTVILAMFVVTTFAYSAPGRAILPLSQVKPGQRAVGKSVFKGTQIQSFNLQIIGVMPRFEGTRSVILARVLDGPVVKRQTAIIEGMSGSPVYINGQLIGAIAYGWQYSKEPIAGIQPIEYMLDAWKQQPVVKPTPTPAASLAQPLTIGGTRIDRVEVAAPGAAKRGQPGTLTLAPLGGLIQVSGMNARATARLNEGLSQYGLRAVAGAGGGSLDSMHPALLPGASIGALLCRGDVDMAGLGTITYLEDGKLLAFGHPFFQLGQIDLPMTGGYVYDIMPTLDSSFKIMAPTAIVGRIYRDHAAAIAGELKKSADLLPVSVEVSDRGTRRTFNFEVIREKNLMPLLVSTAMMTVVDEARTRVARGTVRSTLDLEFRDRPAIHRTDLGYSDSDAAAAALPMVLAPLSTFSDSPLGVLPIKRVHLKMEFEDAHRTASIERVVADQSRYHAGDTVTLEVTLRPYAKDLVTMPVQFALPADLPKGPVRVVVSGGRDASVARAGIGSPLPDPLTLDQLVEQYAQRNASSELVVQVALTRTGAQLLGEELPDLPRSAYDTLQSVRPTDLRAAPSLLKAVVPTDWAISGREMLTLQVESDVGGVVPPRTEPTTPRAEPTPDETPDDSSSDDTADIDFSTRRDVVLPMAAAPAPPKEAPKDKTKPQDAKPEAKEGEEAAPKPAGDQKPLTSAPAVWVQRTRGDYAKAKLRGVAVAADGTLSLAPAPGVTGAIPAEVVWSVAVKDGVAYVGTGTDGVIYKASPSGEVAPFFHTDALNVNALAFDASGNLYAATSPKGKLFRIAPDGTGKVLFDSDRAHLWALALAPDGTLYVGAGTPAGIYAISPDGNAKLLTDLKATNVVSLLMSKGGDLYAGTANAGLVYRVTRDGAGQVVAQAPGSSANALALDSGGNLYVAAAPGGDVWRVPASGLAGLYVRTEQQSVYALAALPDNSVIAATGPTGVLLRMTDEGEWQTLTRPDAGLATALAVSGDTLYLASTGPSSLQRFALTGATSGQLESSVLDAERPARWGRATVAADAPEGSEVKVATRSGDSPNPGDQWSPWTATNNGVIQSPPARYLQYRLTLSRAEGKPSPTVREVRISRQPKNRQPIVAVRVPAAESSVSKKLSMRWEGRDPDQNSLVYDVSISSDFGKTWKDLKTDIADTKYDWDTTKTPDGTYLVRVTASDRRSQPWTPEAATDSVVTTVDNTPPTLVLNKQSLTVGDDRRATLSGVASDKTSPIVSVEYRIDDGDWRTVPFSSLDAQMTDFSFTTDPLPGGDRKLEVRTFDAAGNVASDKVTATVKDASKPTEVKPAEKPGETAKPAEAKPAEAKPEAKPSEAKPAAKPSEAKPQAKPASAKPAADSAPSW